MTPGCISLIAVFAPALGNEGSGDDGCGLHTLRWRRSTIDAQGVPAPFRPRDKPQPTGGSERASPPDQKRFPRVIFSTLSSSCDRLAFDPRDPRGKLASASLCCSADAETRLRRWRRADGRLLTPKNLLLNIRSGWAGSER